MNNNYGSLDTISVAISYSRSTHEAYNEAIIEQIMNFERRRNYKVSIYIDRLNNPGDDYTRMIQDNFEKADIIICLVSNLFLESDFVRVFERPIIQKCALNENKRAIPIIVTRTPNYTESWMGNLRRSTLPTEEAIQKPYSSYSNKRHADKLIEISLDKTFKTFHKQVVSPRVREAKEAEKKPIYKNSVIRKIIIYASCLLLLVLFLIFKSKYGESLHGENEKNVKQNKEESFEQSEEWENDNDYPLPESQDDTRSVEEYVHYPKPRIYSQDLPAIKMCLSKSSMETPFPRDLSMYPYFGKQPYGTYESCQGLNETGYKPCKRNRIWFIVNEEKDQHLKLKVDRETQDKIYAIRPLLNNVAEVYFYDESGMYLSFCISLDDGGQIE